MLVEKVLNNNLVRSSQGTQECLVMGKGIGFAKKPGDPIDPLAIEKIYKLHDDERAQQLISLLEKVELTYVRLANEIIDMALSALGKPLNPSIYISLTDHLNFAIERFHKNQLIQNSLLDEIRLYYPTEFDISLRALDLVQARLGILLPESEAAYIAMHLLNAELNQDFMTQTNDMTLLIKACLDIVRRFFAIEGDESSLDFIRFVQHLKFFSVRLFKGKSYRDGDPAFINIVHSQYPREHDCALAIRRYVLANFSQEISDTEVMYLTIYIRRLRRIDADEEASAS